MSTISRRDALKAIGVGAPAAGFIAEKIKRDMVTNSGIANITSCQPEPAASCENLKFTNFADWFKRFGCEVVKKEARQIFGFDGDIIDMHLPMVTKIRMQRTRNYARLLEDREHWFNNALRANGVVTWWG